MRAAVTLREHRFEVAVFATERERRAASLALQGLPALLLWPRERFLKLEPDNLPAPSHDVVCLDRAGRIVDVAVLERENPEGIVPRLEAAAALLLTRGDVARIGIQPGDAAVMENLPEAEDLTLLRIGGVEARVEVPVTTEECLRGLMFRPRMSADEGMFFDNRVESPRLNAWMKNTLIPLDVAFFRDYGSLVNVVEMPPAADPRAGPWPPSFAAGPARFALEMNRGWFRRNGLVNAEGEPAPGIRAEIPPGARRG